MAEVKRFMVWLAKRVYIDKQSDEEILQGIASAWHISNKEWAQAQIDVVRGNPKFYKEMSSHA